MKKQKKNNKNVTELVFILDRSGSMAGLEADTIGGFNSLLQKQQQEEGSAFVTTVLFDHMVETLHDRVDIHRVPFMTARDFTVRGCTALLDAVGQTIERIDLIHKYARAEDVPQKTLFVITTDGMENASHHYTTAQIKALIEQHKSEKNWDFLFLGANIDAVKTAGGLGIAPSMAADYHADSKGTHLGFDAVCATVAAVRHGAPIAANWKDDIDKDFKKRKRGRRAD